MFFFVVQRLQFIKMNPEYVFCHWVSLTHFLFVYPDCSSTALIKLSNLHQYIWLYFIIFSYLLVLWLKALLLQLLKDKINEDIQLKNIEVSSFSSDHMSILFTYLWTHRITRDKKILFFKRVHTDKCKKKKELLRKITKRE
jgi:hypothetical protein